MWKSNFAIAVGLTACHPAMMNDEEPMRTYLDDTRRETLRHADAVRAAATMSGVRAEQTRHREGMTPMMVDIDSVMEEMASHCDGSGIDDMTAMHGELDGEVAVHATAMAAIEDLDAANVEVERHASITLSMMDGMGGAMDRMRCR